MQVRKIQSDDVCLWPDGSWCFHGDLSEYESWHSDDYQVVPAGTPEWAQLTEAEETCDADAVS